MSVGMSPADSLSFCILTHSSVPSSQNRNRYGGGNSWATVRVDTRVGLPTGIAPPCQVQVAGTSLQIDIPAGFRPIGQRDDEAIRLLDDPDRGGVAAGRAPAGVVDDRKDAVRATGAAERGDAIGPTLQRYLTGDLH